MTVTEGTLITMQQSKQGLTFYIPYAFCWKGH